MNHPLSSSSYFHLLFIYTDWWFQTCHIWDVILPIDKLIFFKMVIAPPTGDISPRLVTLVFTPKNPVWGVARFVPLPFSAATFVIDQQEWAPVR